MEHNKPNSNKSVNLTIDGIPVTVPEGTRILEAALKAGIRIPTFCDHEDLCRRAVCRICVVEGDGRGKLMAACANDVWEGANIVTNSLRIMDIRKTILELILANHPQECLSCVRNKKCELQNLAAFFGISSSPFQNDPGERREIETNSLTLVRDMDKCVKCGRCVEACQELQTVRAINSSYRSVNYEISAAYRKALSDGPCILCGRCASVCPVGAIYEYDDSEEVSKLLNNKERCGIAQFAPAVIEALEGELKLKAGTVTAGKLAGALKLLGFEKVLDAGLFAGVSSDEEFGKLRGRLKSKSALPMIVSCSPALGNFVSRFYGDLAAHLPSAKSPEENFVSFVKERFAAEFRTDAEPKEAFAVSIIPCASKKFEAGRIRAESGSANFALTPRELAWMIRIAGIEIGALPETPFDSPAGISPAAANGPDNSVGLKSAVRKIYEAYTGKIPGGPSYREAGDGIKEAEIDFEGEKVKILAVSSLAAARKVMDSILRGECDAAFVHVTACDSCVGP